MTFKTIMMATGVVLILGSVEPLTGLLKVSVALVGAAVGATLADPVAPSCSSWSQSLIAFSFSQ